MTCVSANFSFPKNYILGGILLTLPNRCNFADTGPAGIVLLSRLLLLVTPRPNGRWGFSWAAAS